MFLNIVCLAEVAALGDLVLSSLFGADLALCSVVVVMGKVVEVVIFSISLLVPMDLPLSGDMYGLKTERKSQLILVYINKR